MTDTTYDWCSSWLKADDYEHILTHAATFQQLLGLEVYPARSHPAAIISTPVHGSAYFLKGKSLSLDVTFPVLRKSVYKWKKSGIPKQARGVSYLVAEASQGEHGEKYRMLAVTLSAHLTDPYILCHIRKIEDSTETHSADESPYPVKKAKKEEEKKGNGLIALLDAANSLKFEGDAQEPDREIDYVSLFQCPSVSKFPFLSASTKPAFEVLHR